MSTNVNIAKTPIAPYLGLLDSLDRNEKIAVALFLVDSLPGIEIVETAPTASQDAADEAFLDEKIRGMKFSPRVERLFERRSEAAQAIDMNDERTRYMLGL